MLRQYLLIIRTFWFGGLWMVTYLARPLLEQQGYFPHHGIELVHATMGVGIACGITMFFFWGIDRKLNLRRLEQQLILILIVLSALYFTVMPYWRLQMIVVHMSALIALVTIYIQSRRQY